MDFLSEAASMNPWNILGWLVVAFIAAVAGWGGLTALSDRRRNSRYRSTGV
jgi:hypothetical protein